MSHREIAEVLGISVNMVQESISISLKKHCVLIWKRIR